MNGSCAGGTGAFIDQMAVLLDVTPSELDELAQGAERIYTIASRCGVFAKVGYSAAAQRGRAQGRTAASIFQAVVNQTIAGLAQGPRGQGRCLFLGGPLFFFKGLRRFQETLGLDDEHAHFPLSRRMPSRRAQQSMQAPPLRPTPCPPARCTRKCRRCAGRCELSAAAVRVRAAV